MNTHKKKSFKKATKKQRLLMLGNIKKAKGCASVCACGCNVCNHLDEE